MTRVSRKEGHLILAGVRVLEHLNGRSPTPEQLADLLETDASSMRLHLTWLEDLGVVSLVQSAYETHVEIRDHHKVEELSEDEGPAISEDLKEFDEKKKAEAERMAQLFDSGEHEQKRQDKLKQMGEDLEDFKRKKPKNPFD